MSGEVIPLRLVPALHPLPAEAMLLRPVALFVGSVLQEPRRAWRARRRPGPEHHRRGCPLRVQRICASRPLLDWKPRLKYAARSLRPGPRPKSLGLAPLSELELRQLAKDEAELRRWGVLQARPRTLGECDENPGPCPWVGCRANLFLEVNPRNGAIKLNFPDKDVEDLEETCAFRIARLGGASLETVGRLINLTQERTSRIEEGGLAEMKRAIVDGQS